jgi:hypothetical protein
MLNSDSQWLLEYGGAQITDTNNEGESVWTVVWYENLRDLLVNSYTRSDDGDCVLDEDLVVLTTMVRVMVVHGAAAPANRARRCAAVGTAPSVPVSAAGSITHQQSVPAPPLGHSAQLRGAHNNQRVLGHGAWGPLEFITAWRSLEFTMCPRKIIEEGHSPARCSARLQQKRQ